MAAHTRKWTIYLSHITININKPECRSTISSWSIMETTSYKQIPPKHTLGRNYRYHHTWPMLSLTPYLDNPWITMNLSQPHNKIFGKCPFANELGGGENGVGVWIKTPTNTIRLVTLHETSEHRKAKYGWEVVYVHMHRDLFIVSRS